VPETQFGYQYPRSGNGIAGIIGWHARFNGSTWVDETREYLHCKMLQPMQAGARYCVTFYANTSVTSTFNYNYVGLDKVGISFSHTMLNYTSGNTITIPYHIVNTPGNYITDTSGWVKISGIYTAVGGEQWLTAGCFGSGVPSSIPVLNAVPSSEYSRSYLFFDDFSIVPITPGDTVRSVKDTFACNKDNVSLTLTSTAGSEGVYTWSNGSTSETLQVNALGTYWCRAIGNCQVHIDTFHVIYDPSKKLSLGNDTGNCFNQPFLVKAPAGFTNLLWSNGATTPDIWVNNSGKYILQGNNQCGHQSDTISIHIQPPTDPPVVKDTFLCQFVDQPYLKVGGSGLLWYVSPTAIIGSPYTPYINTRDPGMDVVYVSQTVGKCESPRVPMNIKIAYLPRKELPDRLTMCEKYILPIGKELPGVTYKWSTGATTCCVRPTNEGTYRLAVSNECGTFVDTVRITLSVCDVCVTTPNAFTPNGDGNNDRFKAIVTCPLDNFQLLVYNRWGNKVYDSRNPDEGWDGTYNGVLCDNGAYVYVLQYRSASTYQINKLQGSIYLLR
jgi:gliding motility-associated-like protein